MQFLSVSWRSLHLSTFHLAEKIKTSGERFDLIVSIARGGLTISQLLSDFLTLPITSFTISSYRDLKQHKYPEITFKMGDKLTNKKILLVDDVSDSGKTFIRGIRYLKDLGAKEIKTTALFIKPKTKFVPDYYLKKINQWVVFPYEPRETIEQITKMLKKEGASFKQIKQRLLDLKIAKKYIEKYVSS